MSSAANASFALTNRAIPVETGGMATPHNYYSPETYIQRSGEMHKIHLRDTQRAAYATEAFICGLHRGIEEEVGDASNLIMYKSGYNWGIKDANRFANRMRQEFGGGKTEIWQMNRQFVLECWWWPLTTMGWGAWQCDFNYERQGMAFITITNSMVAKSMEQVGKPVCHMYAGMFAGFFSVLNQREKGSIEVECYSMGNDCCKFLIGEGERVNAAEFWHREGANAEEILQRLL